MSLQIARGRVSPPAAGEVEAWRRQFDAAHCIRVVGLLESGLLSWLRRGLSSAGFVERIHKDLSPPAVDLALAEGSLLASLFVLLNDRTLFDVVRSLSGCDPVGCFQQVVYRMEAGGLHHDTWHDDNDGNRMVAMSINVGEPYEGGVLQIRSKQSGRILHEVANTGPGDAILFRIHGDLEHYVTPVTGRHAKMALAGWFQRTPPALAILKGLA